MSCFVVHLESALDGTRLPHDRIQTLHRERPLWVRYDLDAVRRAVSPETISSRASNLWRYQELLPMPDGAVPVTLGEGMSPLLPAPRLAERLGLEDLRVKDESQLPTGSFKSRGLSVAVTMAKHFGLRRLAIPSAGNAGGALAAYASRAGLEAFVFMPQDTPVVNQIECVLAGAKVFLVDGLITDCGKIVRGGVDAMGWFDCSTLKEPYRIEGKKTMGLELAEQLGWKLPDIIVYPTGGGTGLIGMWKAFAELIALGWLKSPKLPRMVVVQSDGCAPIVRAFEGGRRFAEPWENAQTCASGLRVPSAVGDFMILDAVRESGGWAIAVDETRIVEMMHAATNTEGISFCPEAAACLLGIDKLRLDGRISREDQIVMFNTGAGTKYREVVRLDLPILSDPNDVDYAELVV